jgi:HlyD family secretion protein
VLRVIQESHGPVSAGTPLIEVGDTRELEAVIDVLSGDAAAIRPGMPAWLAIRSEAGDIPGIVRTVEPSGFTKLSALGVEEQRVNVIVDFDPGHLENLRVSDGYRVDARIVVWEESDVLKVPVGALFRRGTDWATFVVSVDEGEGGEQGDRSGRAVLRVLRLGRMNGEEAQVLAGLDERDHVIIHPSDKVKDGIRVAVRE